jgi:hypothetical protein
MGMKKVEVYECSCEKCGKGWVTRKLEKPERCPYCGARTWDVVGERSKHVAPGVEKVRRVTRESGVKVVESKMVPAGVVIGLPVRLCQHKADARKCQRPACKNRRNEV